MRDSRHLITAEFLSLNILFFLNFCNVTVFFPLHHYLHSLPIAPKWFGLLIGFFALGALITRPLISMLLRPSNCRRWIACGLFLTIATLLSYRVATGFWSMTLVRTVHGVAFALISAGVMTSLVNTIPEDRSGPAFRALYVSMLLPFGIIPPVLGPFTRWSGSFLYATDSLALIMVLGVPLLMALKTRSPAAGEDSVQRITVSAVAANLRNRAVMVLVFTFLALSSALAVLLYFIKGYGLTLGPANPGWFLTLFTLTAIAERALSGNLPEKFGKAKLLAISLIWLASGLIVLSSAPSMAVFFAMAVFLGLGRGVAAPLVQALMFDISEPTFRAFNSNLLREVSQGGFFLGPALGGIILLHWGYAALFCACSGLILISLALVPMLSARLTGNERGA